MIRRHLVVLEVSVIFLGLVDAFHVNNRRLQPTGKPLFPFDRAIPGRSGTSLAFFWQKNNQVAEGDDSLEKPKDDGTGPDVKTAEVKAIKRELNPKEQAEQLKAQAQRARLEAERMDAELTIQKLNRLEKDMKSAAAKGDTATLETLQAQMDQLQAKVRGEAPKPKVVVSTFNSTNIAEPTQDVVVAGESLQEKLGLEIAFSQERFDELKEVLDTCPSITKKLMAQIVEVDFNTSDDINVTEVALRFEQAERLDFSYSSLPRPTFTDEDIQRAKETIQPNFFNVFEADAFSPHPEVKEAAESDEEKLALIYLEYEYYASSDINEDNLFERMGQLAEGEEWLQGIIDAVNTTAVDSTISNLYPKCTRKEDAVLPTMAQMSMLTSDILPKASFTPQGKPEQVLSGYIVRGYSNLDSGDGVIAAIDAQLEKTNLKDKLTVLYTKDFSLLAAEDMMDMMDFSEIKDPENEPPILFVMGKDILVERNRAALTLTTMVGVSTSWYLALYPFLLNPILAKRVEEQLALADSNMAYDLGWLTDLSVPLFLAFLGIQVLHELAHRAVASIYDTKLHFPVFVPSLVTGITSPVTTFKEPPKSKEAMFDIALAGPVTGVLASLAALVLGTQLTVVSDPTSFPVLPVEILRQSTLGGSIIDSILGNGALSIPEGALGSAVVSTMTVSLHPLAIAGYIGLIVNSLALLPIGTTDGGRAALCMYGRGTRLLVGNFFLFAVFLAGTLGSDLFLFYFAYVIAFQTGNEIPARNEVDDISFPRIAVGLASTVVALLVLIPFQ